MKITAIIADDRRPEGWPECYTATRWDANSEDHRRQIEAIVTCFNHSLQSHELSQRVLSTMSEEIDEGDAFNMGMAAWHRGTNIADNYWPAGHANHQAWQDGWNEAREHNEEGEGDE